MREGALVSLILKSTNISLFFIFCLHQNKSSRHRKNNNCRCLIASRPSGKIFCDWGEERERGGDSEREGMTLCLSVEEVHAFFSPEGVEA